MTVNKNPDQFYVELLGRQKITEHTFEIYLSRPLDFTFTPGQRIQLRYAGIERDYTLTNAPDSEQLTLCVRRVADGRLSPLLASASFDIRLLATGPHGYFTFKSTNRCPVFIATGTGIAPFAAMARSGIADFVLLHGVRRPEDLYYRDLFTSSAGRYIPCISGGPLITEAYFNGRVTTYLNHHLEPMDYDFYLCGRNDMIRDVLWLVDECFPGSLVYTEIFF